MNSLDIIKRQNAEAVAKAHLTAPITTQLVIDVLDEIVAERPDYVYPKREIGWQNDGGACVYRLESGEPACLIGVLMARLGLPLPEFDCEDPARVVFSDSLATAKFDGRQIDIPNVAALATFLSHVQMNQDESHTWSVSLKDAREVWSYRVLVENGHIRA